MPVHGLTPSVLFLLAVWSILMPSSSNPQHNLCRLIQTSARCNNAGLTSVPFGLVGNIDELQLNHNRIQTLPSNSFLDYPLLCTLSLVGNDLEKIEANSFGDSHRLESLYLAENNLHIGYEETNGALLKLPRLRVLDLSENNLEDDMAAVLLQNLTSLEYLNLSRNLLLRLDEGSFEGLPQLKELDLHGNRLFELDNAFDSTPKLQRLNLAFNYLPCLIDFHMTQLVVLNASHNFIEWFIARQDLNDTFQLETLDLTENKLLFFPFLPSQSCLRNLYLSYNSVRFYENMVEDDNQNWITSVQFYNLNGNLTNVTAQLWDEDLHGDLSSLEILDLRWNQVDQFPRGFISRMPALSQLWMRTNCLENFNLSLERFPSSLHELDVSNNRLSEVVADQGALAALGNLTYLNMSLNSLTWLPSGLFSSLESLRSVDLSYNSISICPYETAEEHWDSVSECMVWTNVASLRQLYLRGCGIQRVPSSAFAGMLLTHLELSENPGLIMETRTLQSLSRTLQHLGLGNTDIQGFDFAPFHRLKSLNISRNALTHLPPSLSNLGLHTLDLSDNMLSTIPYGQAKALAVKLRTVFLTGNLFNCCQMEWYGMFEMTKTVDMVGRGELLCLDQAKRTHRIELHQLHLCEDKSKESSFWYLLLILSVCLSFVGILIIFLLTFRPSLLQKSIKKKYPKPTSY